MFHHGGSTLGLKRKLATYRAQKDIIERNLFNYQLLMYLLIQLRYTLSFSKSPDEELALNFGRSIYFCLLSLLLSNRGHAYCYMLM